MKYKQYLLIQILNNMKYKFFAALMFLILSITTSCTKRNVTIFQIGQSRESVINTIVSDFIVRGKHISKEKVLDRENGNHITLYECEYEGQYYRKVRVYYDNEKVSQMQLKIPKDKFPNLLSKLEEEYGLPHKTGIPKYFTREDAVVFMGEQSAVVVFENGDPIEYEIMLVSGEKKEQLNQLMK
jgi:hypothetical protein